MLETINFVKVGKDSTLFCVNEGEIIKCSKQWEITLEGILNLNLLIGHPFSPGTLLYPEQQVYLINLKLQY